MGEMKVHVVNVWTEDLGLKRPYTIAGETISSSENAFITLTLEDGTTGIGSASPSERVCGESMKACVAALRNAAELLRHADLRHFDALRTQIQEALARTPAARAAADIALFDTYCKALDVRIVDYLGMRCQALPTSVTIGIQDMGEVQADLHRFIARGFHCIKVKIGNDLAHDIEVIKRIRGWGGDSLRIRVDANQGYNQEELLTFIAQTNEANVELIEQPFRAPALDAMRALDEEVAVRCMADEDLLTYQDALALSADPMPYGLWNIKLMKSGGITVGKQIADLGALHGVPVMWGCMDESIVSISAALHAAYASRNTAFLDLDGSFDLARDVVSGGFVVREGHLYLTDAPGLGVNLL